MQLAQRLAAPVIADQIAHLAFLVTPQQIAFAVAGILAVTGDLGHPMRRRQPFKMQQHRRLTLQKQRPFAGLRRGHPGAVNAHQQFAILDPDNALACRLTGKAAIGEAKSRTIDQAQHALILLDRHPESAIKDGLGPGAAGKGPLTHFQMQIFNASGHLRQLQAQITSWRQELIRINMQQPIHLGTLQRILGIDDLAAFLATGATIVDPGPIGLITNRDLHRRDNRQKRQSARRGFVEIKMNPAGTNRRVMGGKGS